MSIRTRVKSLIPNRLMVHKLNKKGRNSVLLTFDDGPHPDVTSEVLDLLDLYDAKAVFFVVGRNLGGAPHILKKILERGHIIGNHTYIHSNGKQPGFLSYVQDLRNCQVEIEELTAIKPELFRPAHGLVSVTTLLAPKILGLRTINFSLSVNDWQCDSLEQAKEAAELLLNLVKPGDILLLHDDNVNVISILEIVLPEMKNRKYDLKNGIKYL